MTLNPITGLNTINNFLRIFKKKIPVDAPIIKLITKRIIARSLTLYFNKLRQADELMSFETLQNFTDEELAGVCFERGIEI